MRAGTLDRVVAIQRVTSSVDAFGAVSESWATLATVRAQLVQSILTEHQRANGANSESALTFAIRFTDVTLADRLVFDGAALNITEIKEIGRRSGLEIQCERIGP